MITQGYLEEMAARLAERLAQDIEESKTREEHIRTTARANEAAELLILIRTAVD
jgi:ATP-dependent exoDNAse (exonuclease V) beta subunit